MTTNTQLISHSMVKRKNFLSDHEQGRISTLPTLINIVLEFVATAISWEKYIRCIKSVREIIKLSADNMILYHRTTVVKIVWYWQKNRHKNQWNKIESTDINPHMFWSTNLWQRNQKIQWVQDSLFNKWYQES